MHNGIHEGKLGKRETKVLKERDRMKGICSYLHEYSQLTLYLVTECKIH